MKKFLIIALLFLGALCSGQALDLIMQEDCSANVPFQSSHEPETKAWLITIAANGGTVSANSIWAADQYVKDTKSDGDRALIQYALPCVGDNIAAAQCPLINDVGTAVATLNGTAGGWVYDEINGIHGNGTDNYIDTGATLTSIGANEDWHLAAYSAGTQETHASLAKMILGAYTDAGKTIGLILRVYITGSPNGVMTAQGQISHAASFTDLTAGHYLASRITSTNFSQYKNGSFIGRLIAADACDMTSNNTLTLLAANSGSISLYNQNPYTFFTFGYALNDAAAAREGARQARFKARMGR